MTDAGAWTRLVAEAGEKSMGASEEQNQQDYRPGVERVFVQ